MSEKWNRRKKAQELLRGESLDVTIVKLDIGQSKDIAAVIAYIINEYCVLDILINNAAVYLDRA